MSKLDAPEGYLQVAQQDGIIIVTGHGFWQDAEVDAHFAALAALVDQQRRIKGYARGLIDLRTSAVQRAALIDEIRVNANAVWHAGDRVAIVASAALLRLQMARIADDRDVRIFADLAQARIWLAEGPADRREGAPPSPVRQARRAV